MAALNYNCGGPGATVSILLGNGDGTLGGHTDFPTAQAPSLMAVGDFNGDGRLDVAVAAVENNTVSLLLQGPTVVLSPVALTFATQVLGTTSANQEVMLTNSGDETLSISNITIAGTAKCDFQESNTCGTSLGPGASCTITVGFRAKKRGTRTASVSISDNAPGSPQTVSLTGTGTLAKLSPASLNFGNQTVGTTSNPLTVTLSNASLNASFSISKIGISGENAASFAQTNNCPASLAPGASCAISVTFTPKTKGAKSATLNIHDDAGGSPQTVALSGTGS